MTSRVYRRVDCSVCGHKHLTRAKRCEACTAERGWEIIDEEGLTRLAELVADPVFVRPDAWPKAEHYNRGKIEAIAVIEDWGLNFSLGNVVKYIARVDPGDAGLSDLKKARTYLDREIHRRVTGGG